MCVCVCEGGRGGATGGGGLSVEMGIGGWVGRGGGIVNLIL